TYPRVCLLALWNAKPIPPGWFSQTLMHQYLGTYLRNKSLNLGIRINIIKDRCVLRPIIVRGLSNVKSYS
ncbi:MAG: hypothetical protein U9R02_05650, partial [Thermodesulfobacteriota bacterium]|nr:hypothetical protein [Thermodesulfobacteriota bacterium]